MSRFDDKTKSKSRHWKAYGTKHPEKYEMKEFTRVSSKFSHSKKIKVKKK
jgi:hypothetical protein|tara:strand:+ start:407 stop:556 length:150 start_codon:yes stop_codon:yes gene_type:complete